MNKRPDNRTYGEVRKVHIQKGYVPHAEGSCLFSMGRTKVLCVASVEQKVPPFLQGTGGGWISADYAMLPRAGNERSSRNKVASGGRSQEIQRIIGRALRAIIDLSKLGEHTIMLDCDVLLADGGTRTAAINGSYIALMQALTWMQKKEMISEWPLRDTIGAVSVGLLGKQPLLDLCYEEDKAIRVDLNVVMTGSGKFIEIQGTAEREPCTKKELDEMLLLAHRGITQIIGHIKRSLI